MNIIEILNRHKFTVLWSGGKDSTAALLWVLDNVNHKNWNILYVEMTGNTHPLCTEYVKKTAEKLGLMDKLKIARTRDFYEVMDKWGPPLMFTYRWCLKHLKAPAFKSSYYFLVDGIRRSESSKRRRLTEVTMSRVLRDRVSISPIIDWTDSQVYSYIKQHGIELNPCYKLYGQSGNCMFCPYADKRSIILVMNDPEWRNKILPILEKHRDGMMKGNIGRQVYERWTQYPKQKTLQVTSKEGG
jgi:3'-phosphoadenosine 5'-phosphosulfate sulfotransferase (PAPS reductase)/FAD synthetase